MARHLEFRSHINSPSKPARWSSRRRTCITTTCAKRTAALDTSSPPASLLAGGPLLAQQAAVMAGASAVVGPFLDNQHSLHGVLAYAHPIRISLPGLLVETTWWTPLLFALAGVIIGAGTPALDELLSSSPDRQPSQSGGKEPSWGVVLLGIALFVLQYWASAELDGAMLGRGLGGTSVPATDAALAAAAVATWAALDATPQGLFMAGLTAVAGPAVEMALISQGLYSYAHPAFLGLVPTWIAWTYFAGGPAVGNLGRKVAAELKRRRAAK